MRSSYTLADAIAEISAKVKDYAGERFGSNDSENYYRAKKLFWEAVLHLVSPTEQLKSDYPNFYNFAISADPQQHIDGLIAVVDKAINSGEIDLKNLTDFSEITDTFTFANSGKITDDGGTTWESRGFHAGNSIIVSETSDNNGTFTIVSLAGAEVTVEESIVNENSVDCKINIPSDFMKLIKYYPAKSSGAQLYFKRVGIDKLRDMAGNEVYPEYALYVAETANKLIFSPTSNTSSVTIEYIKTPDQALPEDTDLLTIFSFAFIKKTILLAYTLLKYEIDTN